MKLNHIDFNIFSSSKLEFNKIITNALTLPLFFHLKKIQK